MDKNLIQRAVSGFIYVLILMAGVHPVGASIINSVFPDLVQQHQLYYGLITLLFLACTWECVQIMKFGSGYEKWVVLPLAIFVFYIFSKRFFGYGFYFDFRFTEILANVLILIAAVTLFKYTSELYYDSGKLIFIVIYLALPFGFALGLPKYSAAQDTFTLEVFFLFILIWASDTFAYLTGRFFGKHKMAPKISPKKTWEGFAGGVILTLLLGFFVEKYNPEMRGNWMIVGLLVAVFAPLGDLMESQLKRSFGVKDSGKLIPGHGGVLDRLDSFIICAPVVYLYFVLSRLL